MEALTFFSAMNRGQFREEQGIEGSSYCIFFAPMEELVTQDRMTGREDRVVLELLYGDEMLPGALRVRQVGSNAVVEESTQGGVSRLPGGEAGQVHRTTADVRASVQNTGSLPAH